jgi:hypothetical protein
MNLGTSDRETSAVPSELTGPSPRKVRLKLDRGDARFLLTIVLLFLVGGSIWLGWNAYYDLKQFQQRAVLRSDGREVVGEVTGFAYHRFDPLGIIYRFSVNGATYSSEALEPKTPVSGSALDKGDNLPLLFLPSNPKINHLAAWEWSVVDGWYTTAGAVGGIVIGAVVLAGLLRNRKLARYGKAASGVVRGCARDGRLFRTEYEFGTERGISMRGKYSGPDEYGPGARIWILYLPQKLQRNSRYPWTSSKSLNEAGRE